MNLKRRHGVKQHEAKDCGAACLATICKYYGVNVPLPLIRDWIGVDKTGSSIYGIIQGAKKLFINAEGLEGEFNDLYNSIKEKQIKLPIIVNIIQEGSLHFIVLWDMDKTIKIFDPAGGSRTLTIENFKQIWTGAIITLTPEDKFYSLKKKWKPFKKYFDFFLEQKFIIVLILLLSLVFSLIAIATSFSYQEIIDTHIFNYERSGLPYEEIMRNFWFFVFILFFAYLIQGFIMFIRNLAIGQLTAKLTKRFLLFFYNHLIHLKESYFVTHESGDTIVRYQTLSEAQSSFFQILLSLIVESIMIIVGGLSLYNLNKTLFIMTLVILVIYAVIVLSFIKPLNKITRAIQENEAESLTHMNETLDGIESIKMFNSESFFYDKFNIKVQKMTNNIKKSIFLQNILYTLIFVFEKIGMLSILIFGTLLVMSGDMSLGTLISFEAISLAFIGPFKVLINIQEDIQNVYITLDRLNDILEVEKEDNCWIGEETPVFFVPEIVCSNVDFSYSYKNEQLININITFEKYSKTGVVGVNGCGKTTLLKLISTLIIPTNGEIKINNINVQNYQLTYLRKNIVYVPQESFFINGTIEENLLMGYSSNNKEYVNKIFNFFKIYEIEENLQLSNNGVIVENGSNLSSGQKQKLAIAKALIKQPKILLLDEATSNLDTEAEKDVFDFINRELHKTTVISIIHNENLLFYFDRILVLDGGRIAKYNSPNEI